MIVTATTGSDEVVVHEVQAVTLKVEVLLTILPLNPGARAVISESPIHAPVDVKPVAVATPVLLMTATWGSLEDQVT
jgi:hypothetical protein